MPSPSQPAANLRSRFLRPSNFQQAWERVAQNKGCAGVDGETVAHFAYKAEDYLANLLQTVATCQYHPLPLRQLFIPKSSGGWRTLGVSTVRDRIVQQALLNVLYPILEPQFEPCSFAYRPGRSHQMAVRQVDNWHKHGYDWVLDADIVKYFDTVRHQRLLVEVQERMSQPDFLELIEQWISTGLLTKEGLLLPQKGIPQGSSVSPILANVYLDDFDEILSATKLKLVRFADDFLLLGKSQQQVTEAKEQVADLLEDMGLQLHPDKTRITSFDRGFRFLGHVFVKDLIVATKKPATLKAAPIEAFNSYRLVHTDPMKRPTQMQQAMVEALKATRQPIPPPLFVVLGYTARQPQPVMIESDEYVWRTGMSTLYLVQQGTTLCKEQGRFLVKTEAGRGQTEEVEIPITEVERILVFGNIQLTTAVISNCLEAQIPVVFLSQTGEYKGHLWSAELGDLEAEAAQFQHRSDAAFQLETARTIVWGKLMNSKQLLLRLNRKRQVAAVAEAITGLTRDIDAVEAVSTLDSLRGYEGTAAARYFPAIGHLLTNPGFSFTARHRHPPIDPVNSMLSFGYTLLFNNVLSLILTEGLNPYLGNLHRSDRKELHLAFDLMEEFRSPVVDSLVITLVNQQVMKPTDFTWPNQQGGVYLTDTARRVFLKHFEERISDSTAHPSVQVKVSYRRAIQLQVQRYKHSLLKSTPYEAFLRSV